jgi:hypothetical protein
VLNPLVIHTPVTEWTLGEFGFGGIILDLIILAILWKDIRKLF